MTEGRGKMMTLVSLAVVALTVIGLTSALLITNERRSNEIVVDEPNFADDVTIYQNGYAFVRYKTSVATPAGISHLKLFVPYSVIFDTLRVSGVDVVEIRGGLGADSINVGETLRVTTNNGVVYEGEFTAFDSFIHIDDGQTVFLVNPGSIESIEVLEAAAPRSGGYYINITVDATAGSHELGVSYLIKGPKWFAKYEVDIDTGAMECWAVVRGAETWTSINLSLAAGGPRFISRGASTYTPINYGASMAMWSPEPVDSDWSYTSSEDFDYYGHVENVSLFANQDLKKKLFEIEVEPHQRYFWSSGDVWNQYYFDNAYGRPLPAGIADVYEGGRLLGEDQLKYTPAGDEVRLSPNKAYAITVSTVQDRTSFSGGARYECTTTIENTKDVAITIMVEDYLGSDTNLISSTPDADVSGYYARWTVVVGADSSYEIEYVYEYRY